MRGGDPDFALYLESLVPDMLAYLDDPDPPGPGPEHVPLRQRRAVSQQAAEDRRQQEAQSKDRDQRVKMEGSFGEPVGFQVPFLGCLFFLSVFTFLSCFSMLVSLAGLSSAPLSLPSL